MVKDIIQKLAIEYGRNLRLYETYGRDIIKLYTMGYCSHLAHLLYLYCRREGIECRKAWIVDTLRHKPLPSDANHVGCIIGGKWYDIEYQDGLELSKANEVNDLLDKYCGVRIYKVSEEESGREDGFDDGCGYLNFEDLLNKTKLS